MFKDSNEFKVLKSDLPFILATSSFVSQPTTKLENTINLLSESIRKSMDFQNKLKKTTGSEADAVNKKFHPSFSKNKGFKVMCKISRVQERRDLPVSEDPKT
jgi:hypothetical protein